MTRRNYWIVAAIIIGLALVTSAPHIAGLIYAGRSQVYLAHIPSNPADTAAYFSDIEQARQGHWLFANLLTSEPQRAVIFHPVWLLLGWLAAVTTVSTPLAFQIGRLLALAGVVFLLYRWLATWCSGQGERWLILIVVATSAGFGWTVGGLNFIGLQYLKAPIDLWVDEANTFHTLAHSAQFILSQAMIVAYLYLLWRTVSSTGNKYRWWAGPLIATLGFIHPYDLITIAAVTVAWLSVRLMSGTDQARLKPATWIWLLATWAWAVPVVLYYQLAVLAQPAIRGWYQQMGSPSPSWPAWLMGLGLLVPLAAIGAVTKRANMRGILLTWIIVALALAYAPGLSIQRRLLNGIHIPIAIFAASGLWWLAIKIPRRIVRQIILSAAVVFLSLTNIFFAVNSVRQVVTMPTDYYPPDISRGSFQAINWIKQSVPADDIVFSNVIMGNAIAGLAARRVVIGHGNQTINPQARLDDWKDFSAAATNPDARRAIIIRLGAKWLVWQAGDQQRGGYQPSLDRQWAKRFSAGDTSVYQLQTD